MKTDKLKGLKIAVCQMNVAPGRPDINAEYIINEIFAAEKRQIDVIVFPEMSVPGYFIGDSYERNALMADVMFYNRKICKAASVAGVIAIFGTVISDSASKGEDGRIRKFNSALVAGNDKIEYITKTLQPNYRIFHDDRYFYSNRKACEGRPEFVPIEIATDIGPVKIGVILCEDMWHEDYPLNPAEEFIKNGAEIVFNLSASPWTWRKNQKRHKVVKSILEKNPASFVYVNNAGIQNTGKNIVIFDGSSTVYDENGEIVFEIPPYETGTKDFIFGEIYNRPIPAVSEDDDTTELYKALRCSIEEFLKSFPPHRRKVIVGLSGGIDSALSLALFVDVLGPENVVAINMPSKYNSQLTQDIAREIAENLGVRYEIAPIGDIVEAIAGAAQVAQGTMAYENIQARARMEILAAKSQIIGGVFSCNSNKVEIALGYGTLYGDVAGFMAVLGDLVKREVYQLSDYMNRVVYRKIVIPKKCFEMAPTAELKESQKDPFDYGNLNRRGYHDEMVRAFVEFRRDPEWFIECHVRGNLEKELMLNAGTLSSLFGSVNDFVKDLENNWVRFYDACFKRVQSPPIPIISKRAFGNDLSESILPAYFTQRYYDLKKMILSRRDSRKRIAIYGGSFNPPGKHHRQIAEELAKKFDSVIVVPCGRREDKASVNSVKLSHRKEMTKLAFSGIEKVEIDFYDLDSGVYTPTYFLDKMFREKFPDAQIWHVVGEDLTAGGEGRNSEIHRVWHRGDYIWQDLNFAVVVRPGYGASDKDLPPSSEVVRIEGIYGSGTMIRARIENDESINDLVDPEIESYIIKNCLYEK